MLGRDLSHYHVVEKLGEGGMGVVYKARDSRLERFAALKVLPADRVADPQRKQRFAQEAKAASALNHPNVLTIYDIGTDQGVDFIAMEYIAGRSLDRLIQRHGMRTPEVLRYGAQIADALAAAHAAGIIHRDLKPSNIMITESGLVKVLDFGIAKLSEKTADPDQDTRTMTVPSTDEGTIVGTTAYMSPEQAQGLKLDFRSDIFSLGAVLYEMITGRRAFAGDTDISTLAAILDREPEPLDKTIPRDLDRIITRCLKKTPARRFQTMADLRVALEELKEESESGRLIPLTDAPTRRARWWPLAVAATVIVAIGAAAAWRLWRGPGAAIIQKSELRQLTFDAGENSLPAISPDAKLVAYQSDRADPGNFDIWVQQIAGGAPIRLTNGPGDNRRPVFSGDGSKIYFDSAGPPRGIYEVSALGGQPRLLVANATGPTVSPDGQKLAYVSRAQLFVTTPGGEPRAIARDLSMLGGRALWFADSKYLASFAQKTGQPDTTEFWRIPAAGGEATKMNWSQWGREHGYVGGPSFLFVGRGVTTMARPGGSQQIYLLPGNPETGFAIGEPIPITSGAAWSANGSVAQGKMVFQSGIPETGLWFLPADTNSGRVSGELQRVTPDKAFVSLASATPDGKTLVFTSNKAGSNDVFIRDMSSGQERAVTAAAPDRSKTYALIDASATKVVYSMMTRNTQSWDVYEIATQVGTPRRICELCGPTLSLSANGRHFLALNRADNERARVDVVDVETGDSTALLQHSRFPIRAARFSPDGTRVAFVVNRAGASADVLVAPFDGAAAIPETAWVPITPAAGDTRQVFWSPDGQLVYYDLAAAGSTSLMARRLEREGAPIGDPLKVFEFAGRLRPASSFNSGIPDTLNAVPGGFVGVLAELNYNIWVMDLPK